MGSFIHLMGSGVLSKHYHSGSSLCRGSLVSVQMEDMVRNPGERARIGEASDVVYLVHCVGGKETTEQAHQCPSDNCCELQSRRIKAFFELHSKPAVSGLLPLPVP